MKFAWRVMRKLLLVVLVASVASSTSCKRESSSEPRLKTANPNYPQVPIEVWWVHAGGDNSFPTSPHNNNKGSRLTVQQVSDYIFALDQFCQEKLGFELSYTIVGTEPNIFVLPLPVQDPNIPTGNNRTLPAATWINQSLHRITQSYLEPNGTELLWKKEKIHIFFVGNVQPQGFSTGLNAGTITPGHAGANQATNYWRRHIFVNDRGYEDGDGVYDEALPILEHELVHYLIRESGVCTAWEEQHPSVDCTEGQVHSENGYYSFGEHSSDATNIMAPGSGSFKVSARDKKQIKTRIRAGGWNVPHKIE